MNTAYRHLLMLRMIPRYPRKIDTATIERQLEQQGVVIHRRSIQRDLEMLSALFPLECDDREKPYGWSWSAESPSINIPAIPPPAALAFRMTEGFISNMLPNEVSNQLAPYFRYATSVLDQVDKKTLKNWPDKVRCIGRTQPLVAPNISAEAFAVVSDSLLEGKRFQASYLKRNTDKPVDWTVNPLGLVLHDNLITLVCTMGNYQQLKDVRTMHIHRIQSAQPLDDPTLVPDGFSLDDFVRSGNFGYLQNDRKIRLTAVFAKDAALHLEETPLSTDQKVTDYSGETKLVQATIADTKQLLWWLLGFGGRVEVLEPLDLRNELRRHAELMVQQYS